jgi:hypothetical protein
LVTLIARSIPSLERRVLSRDHWQAYQPIGPRFTSWQVPVAHSDGDVAGLHAWARDPPPSLRHSDAATQTELAPPTVVCRQQM